MKTLLNAIRMALILCVAVSAASANVLVNPGFESPPTPVVPPEYYGAGSGWTSFGGGIYTINSTVGIPPNTGTQLLKMFGGCCSGAFQQFSTNPGEVWNGGVWMRNDTRDLMTGGQVAAVNIEWRKADGNLSDILPFISNPGLTAASPVNVWTLQTVTGAAPADAAFARFVLITGDFGGSPFGGAPFFDDAFFENLTVSVQQGTFGRVKQLFR